ncbi:tachylectin-related carbohydrate-binding protein [Amycolatopsis panacis]|uniref:Peptidase S1 domain-containing protein n=1 Tax=Amycolatopsis panacis TaxID=2340917 RepID=A0A419IA75_9PSEU|nr:tachylectin-related carbohydrate-binding protein [Amycolatopsis panacis]RJQ89676.1 hypothetical protein D5S19_04310 [Amycolatopsis panacis]
MNSLPLFFRRSAALSAAIVAGSLLTVAPAQAVSGGTEVPAKTYDFIARVSADGHGCSGVLAGPEWIITAGTCVPAGSGAPSSPVTVTVGGKTSQVTNLIPRTDRDLVLAKLATPITTVTPVALSAKAPAAGDTLTVAGYGRTANTWVPDKASSLSFTTASVTDTALSLTNADGHDTCKGDAGGPALVKTGGAKLELVGINSRSWQHGCLTVTEKRAGSTEARTDDIVGWIRSQAPELAIQCRATVPIFAVSNDLLLYGHPDPANGGPLGATQSVIGTGGWSAYVRVLAGPDGLIYGIRANGEVYRYRWTGAAWSDDSRTLVATGWNGFDKASNHNLITIDSRGDVYLINPDGTLVRGRYDAAAKTWDAKTVDTGWNDYTLITGAGEGVLYGRTSDGRLYRHVWDEKTHQWTKKLVGEGGWNAFTRISSAGADVLYAVTISGDLRWYRYLPYTETWAPGPTTVGNGGWQKFSDVEAERNACAPR